MAREQTRTLVAACTLGLAFITAGCATSRSTDRPSSGQPVVHTSVPRYTGGPASTAPSQWAGTISITAKSADGFSLQAAVRVGFLRHMTEPCNIINRTTSAVAAVEIQVVDTTQGGFSLTAAQVNALLTDPTSDLHGPPNNVFLIEPRNCQAGGIYGGILAAGLGQTNAGFLWVDSYYLPAKPKGDTTKLAAAVLSISQFSIGASLKIETCDVSGSLQRSKDVECGVTLTGIV